MQSTEVTLSENPPTKKTESKEVNRNACTKVQTNLTTRYEEHFTPDEHLQIHHTLTININKLKTSYTNLAKRVAALEAKGKPGKKGKSSSTTEAPKKSRSRAKTQDVASQTQKQKTSQSKDNAKEPSVKQQYKRQKTESCIV
jgi:hypothetical protein